jgi:hypothetical protein
MPAAVSVTPPIVSVQPGAEGVAEVRIRNTGTIVDSFTCNLVGDASAWARCDPPFVSLLPGGEETVKVKFTPPRSSAVSAGVIAYGVRVTAQEDSAFSVVEEAAVQIAGFSSVEARVVPRTSEGKRKAVHRIEVTNTGNSVVTADIQASDPDELLAFDYEPRQLSVEPGRTEVAKLKLAARKSHGGRGTRRIPFNVEVNPGGMPVSVDGAFEQKPKASLLLILAIVAVAVVVILLAKDQAGALSLLGLLAA